MLLKSRYCFVPSKSLHSLSCKQLYDMGKKKKSPHDLNYIKIKRQWQKTLERIFRPISVWIESFFPSTGNSIFKLLSKIWTEERGANLTTRWRWPGSFYGELFGTFLVGEEGRVQKGGIAFSLGSHSICGKLRVYVNILHYLGTSIFRHTVQQMQSISICIETNSSLTVSMIIQLNLTLIS